MTSKMSNLSFLESVEKIVIIFQNKVNFKHSCHILLYISCSQENIQVVFRSRLMSVWHYLVGYSSNDNLTHYIDMCKIIVFVHYRNVFYFCVIQSCVHVDYL